MSESTSTEGRVVGRGRRVRHRARPTLRGVVAVLAAFLAVVALSGTADARSNHPQTPDVRADGLAGPLSIDVGHRGDVLVGQSFSGAVSSIWWNGRVTDLVNEPGAEAVAYGPFGTVLYTVTDEAGASLKVRLPSGATYVLANLGRYERVHNPDAASVYGISDLTPDCAAQWPEADFGPVTYTGQIDAHPYAIAVGDDGIYIADAAANAILKVDVWGRVRTVAVLAPQPIQIPDDPSVLGLPACVAGHTYNFEPVPTDIEVVGRTGYVSLLPGGPEDASLGARGSVVKVDLSSGAVSPVAGGFAGATDLAVSPSGDIYVTELFAGKITEVSRHGGTHTVAELPDPAAVEWANGRLYVGYDVFASGKVATLKG